jgi:hypothetical protein
VDVDVPGSWPGDLRARIEGLAEYARTLPGGTDEFGWCADEEQPVRALLQGHRLLAYHCTRLLDHEVAMIRGRGIRLLTPDLVEQRICAATTAGAVSGSGADLLRAATYVTSAQPQPGRGGNAYFFTSRTVFDEQVGGVWYLLSEWGGEAIRMTAESRALPDHLVRLGRPSVVVAALEVNVDADEPRTWPAIHKVLVDTLLGSERPGCTVVCRRDVPAAAILDIWQPGHPDYDRHEALPR